MEKLFIWFNPNRKQVYHKICRNSDTPIGSYNQYGHILIEILEIFDNTIYTHLSFTEKYHIMALKRNKRYKRLFNKFFNKK